MAALWGTVGTGLVPGTAGADAGWGQTPLSEETVGLGVGAEGGAGGAGPGWAYLTADGAEGWARVGLHGRLMQTAEKGAGMAVAGMGPTHGGLRASMGGWLQVGAEDRAVAAAGPWGRIELRRAGDGGESLPSGWLAQPELRLDVLAGPPQLVGGPSWLWVGRAVGTVGSPQRRVGVVLELPTASTFTAERWVGPVSPMVGMVVEIRNLQNRSVPSR